MTVTQDSPHTKTGPYSAAAMTYHSHGWSPLPLPPTKKAPVPEGWTGARGAVPSGADVYAWTETHGAGNIGLRLPPNVIGVDVDDYEGHGGGATLRLLESELGGLPPTWRTSSRDDGVSGIRLYRVPEGLRWPGTLGQGIDTIRWDHRYAVVWPSVHPLGGVYRWYDPDGVVMAGGVPEPDSLPDLPAVWVEHFTRGEASSEQGHAGLSGQAAYDWLISRGNGAQCPHVQSAVTRALQDLAGGAGRHDATLRATNRLAWLASQGHTGTLWALDTVRNAFMAAVAGERSPQEADAEWARMVEGAVDIAAAQPPPREEGDPCLNPYAGIVAGETPSAPPVALPPPSRSNHTSQGVQSASDAPGAPSLTPPQPLEPTPVSGENPLDPYEALVRNHYTGEVARWDARRRARAERVDWVVEDTVFQNEVRRRAIEASEPPRPPVDVATLNEVLDRGPEPPHRADGLIPWGGNTLIIAQHKTGKTTFVLNLARALLVSGTRLLGDHETTPVAQGSTVAILNYEVSAATLARWAQVVGVPGDRFVMVNCRGTRNPLATTEGRAALAEQMKERHVEVIIVDPFARAYTGEDQNDNTEVLSWLSDLEAWARNDCGATELVVAAHSGWEGGRVRGATALVDWPDTLITFTRDKQGRRFYTALGRDIEVSQRQVSMDQETKRLYWDGGQPWIDEQVEAIRMAIAGVLQASPDERYSKGALQEATATKWMEQRGSMSPDLKDSQPWVTAIDGLVADGAVLHDVTGSGPGTRHTYRWAGGTP